MISFSAPEPSHDSTKWNNVRLHDHVVCVCVCEREREREREMGCYMAKGMELSKDNMAEYFNFENLKRGLPH